MLRGDRQIPDRNAERQIRLEQPKPKLGLKASPRHDDLGRLTMEIIPNVHLIPGMRGANAYLLLIPIRADGGGAIASIIG